MGLPPLNVCCFVPVRPPLSARVPIQRLPESLRTEAMRFFPSTVSHMWPRRPRCQARSLPQRAYRAHRSADFYSTRFPNPASARPHIPDSAAAAPLSHTRCDPVAPQKTRHPPRSRKTHFISTSSLLPVSCSSEVSPQRRLSLIQGSAGVPGAIRLGTPAPALQGDYQNFCTPLRVAIAYQISTARNRAITAP